MQKENKERRICKLEKLCKKCNRVLDASHFSKDRTHKDGLASNCKDCRKKEYEKWKMNNKEKLKEYQKEYREIHKNEKKIYNQIYRDRSIPCNLKNIRYRKPVIKTKCERCGKEFEKPISEASDRNFCSRECLCKTLAEEYNPIKMTKQVKEKISKSQRTSIKAIKSREFRYGNRELKSYKKLCGRHEHRIVAEQILGRPLKKGEVVHHIDRNKRNNSPDNLMIFKNQSEHAKWHAEHDGR